jgi:hypothetical protein
MRSIGVSVESGNTGHEMNTSGRHDKCACGGGGVGGGGTVDEVDTMIHAGHLAQHFNLLWSGVAQFRDCRSSSCLHLFPADLGLRGPLVRLVVLEVLKEPAVARFIGCGVCELGSYMVLVAKNRGRAWRKKRRWEMGMCCTHGTSWRST